MSKDQEVRETIISAATKLYQKWGIKKTTMEEIAEEAGKGKATLYYYFSNKEEVFTSVIHKQIVEVQHVITDKLKQANNCSEKLHLYLKGMLEEAEVKIEFFNFLRKDIKGDKEFLYRLREMFEDYDHQMIKEIINEGVANKEFVVLDDRSRHTIAMTISSTVRNMIIKQLFEIEEPFDPRDVKSVCDFFVRGLLA